MSGEVRERPLLALRMRDVHRAYGACVANAGAELEVANGEVHALVGENGAGKSTLMRLLAGIDRPDRGTIEVGGRDVTGWSASEAIAAGVGMVHQHFMLVPTLTVAENVVLGREPRRGIGIDMERARRDVRALAEESGLEVPVDDVVGDLSVGVSQRVEILKVLYRGAKLLVLDEPTAVLSPPEVADFLRVLERLRERGTTIVLITHKLAEVMEVSTRVTVMRRGRTVARLSTRETSPAEIARAMVGRDVLLPDRPRDVDADARTDAAPPKLAVRDLVVRGSRGTRAVDGVSFEIRPGEIFGVAGVEGNGQTELVEALAGLRVCQRGSIALGDRDVTRLAVREREHLGLAHVPDDRHKRGLVLDMTVEENLILGRQDRYTRFGLLDRGRIRAHANERIRAFDIRPPDPTALARALSGGNQQKIVIAREMAHGFEVLLAAQPTRGVDVGAIEAIHAKLLEARASGKAILLVSAELPEILALSDRIAVLYRGRFAGVVPRDEATTEKLGAWMTGAASNESEVSA